jgi:hypothetical protein
MPAGTEFIKHEFDEAIAIQQTICESGEILAKSHPMPEVRRQLEAGLKARVAVSGP